ncbi:MAG: SDR family oxidoreductase [Ilumatobacteraceae bacterium]
MADLGDLSGRLALVTGAAGNIGRAVARSLAEHGADLVLADLPASAAGIDDTRAACARVRPDVRIDVATFDVREPEAIVGELTDAAGRLGTPTVVVNNAGYQGRFANVLDYDLDDLVRSSRSTRSACSRSCRPRRGRCEPLDPAGRS